VAEPEQRLARAMIDVLVSYRGLRLAIEGEVDDQPNAAQKAWDKARERITKGIAQLGLAVVYPAELRKLPTAQIEKALGERTLRFAIAGFAADQKPAWHEGTAELLNTFLQEAFMRIASEDEVRRAANRLHDAVHVLSSDIVSWGVAAERVAGPLGIDPGPIGRNEGQRRRYVSQIAALVVSNALLFHEELAKSNRKVKALAACLRAKSPHNELLNSWGVILKDINYHAVFEIARNILLSLPADKRLDDALGRAAEYVLEVARMRAAIQHDLAGRLYHLLLGDIAKPLGTFYTSVSSAELLLRLALDPKRWNVDWSTPEAVGNLLVGDFACGTGTLLAAAVQATLDNFVRATSGNMPPSEFAMARVALLRKLLEHGVWGFDVLQSAVHLTATTLSLPIADVLLKGINLYTFDLGMDKKGAAHLGSLDLLRQSEATPTMSMFPFGRAKGRRATDKARAAQAVEVPFMDLICMNPPFSRTCGDNLLFGSLGPGERPRVQAALRRLVREREVRASITAGLGTVFLDLADRYLKPGGRLAFVLPKALLSGADWAPSRELLAAGYVLEYVIVSHDPERWNFSENTDLSEVLFVARKKTNGEENGRTICVNLWRNSELPLDALQMSEQLRGEVPPLEETPHPLWVGNEKFGEAYTVDWSVLAKSPHWLGPLAFARVELVRVAQGLVINRELSIGTEKLKVPLCPLRDLAELGPDRRRLWATFAAVDKPPGSPAFYGHDSTEVTGMAAKPNAYLTKLSRPRERQKEGYAETLIEQSSRVLIAERMWLNTQRVAAIMLDKPVLANVWWPVVLHPELQTESIQQVLVTWLNSTLGLLLLLAFRTETRGAWVDFKKPLLEAMPVLDARLLNSNQIESLARTWKALENEVLQPLSQLTADANRARIDHAVAEALGVPSLAGLREFLGEEPLLTLRPFRQSSLN